METKYAKIEKSWTAKNVSQEIIHERFLMYIPKNLDYAIAMNLPYRKKMACCYFDSIDFWFRRYLIGIIKDLRNVLKEVRAFQKRDSEYCKTGCKEIISNLEKLILEYEIYEMMPRFNHAKKQIEKIINQ